MISKRIIVELILILSAVFGSIRCQQCNFYTIRNGDTFFALAQQNGLTVNDMVQANPGVDFTRLQIGQVICIPFRQQPLTITTQPPTITTTTPRFITTTRPLQLRCDYVYTVKSGEQCVSIAQLFPAFNSLNPGLQCAFLQPGQRVCIGNANGFPFNQCRLTTSVRPGESCDMIGTRTGSTMEYLYNCNPQINLACNNLNAGQKLNI